MARWTRELPPRRLDLAGAARKRSFAELCMMSDAIDVIAAPPDGSHLVTVEPKQRFEPSGGDRYLRVVPLGGPDDLDRLIAPLPRQHLQCAAIAAAARPRATTSSASCSRRGVSPGSSRRASWAGRR